MSWKVNPSFALSFLHAELLIVFRSDDGGASAARIGQIIGKRGTLAERLSLYSCSSRLKSCGGNGNEPVHVCASLG